MMVALPLVLLLLLMCWKEVYVGEDNNTPVEEELFIR